MSLAETLGPTKTARKLEIPVKTLANGIRRSREGSGFVNDGKRRPVSEREAENARLRAENQREGVPVKSASIASERTHDPIGFTSRGLDVPTSGFFAQNPVRLHSSHGDWSAPRVCAEIATRRSRPTSEVRRVQRRERLRAAA